MLGISSKNLGVSPKNVGVTPKDAAARGEMSGSASSEQFRQMICDEIADCRASGLKRAFVEVARHFGLTERRVRAAWHGELRNVRVDEFSQVAERRMEKLRQRQAQIAHEIAILGQQASSHQEFIR